MNVMAEVAGDFDARAVTEFISNLGFPIFVAVWLLWKSHKDNNAIQTAINKLENALIDMRSMIETILKSKGK